MLLKHLLAIEIYHPCATSTVLTLLPTAPAYTDLTDHNKWEQTLFVLPSSVRGVRSQEMEEDHGPPITITCDGSPTLNLKED